MDQFVALQIFIYALYALIAVVSLLVTYWIIRLAVTHALRSHHYWMQKNTRS